MESGIRKIVLQCVLLVAVAKPEEVFNTTPPPIRTNFSCHGRAMGFYADVDANCKVYHTCDDHGNKFTYRCPEETAFRQDALICDHAHLVDCKATTYSNRRSEPAQEQERADTRQPSFFTTAPFDPRRSQGYSRSFQVVQPARSNSSSSDDRPGFVFSASVFLRDRGEPRGRKLEPNDRSNGLESSRGSCRADPEHSNPRNDLLAAFTTSRPFINRFDPNARVAPTGSTNFQTFPNFQNSRNPPNIPNLQNFENLQNPQDVRNFRNENRFAKQGQRIEEKPEEASFLQEDRARGSMESNRSPLFPRRDNPSSKSDLDRFKPVPTSVGQSASTENPFRVRGGPSKDFFKSPLHYNRDYPYVETLRSIQANSRSSVGESISTTASTTRRPSTSTEIPVHALTMSLKPLVPNELEYDPYYPKGSSTTTEAYYTPSHRAKEQTSARFSTQPPLSEIEFEIPAVLPDLNSLEDLLDRRKLFYIPRVKST